MRMMDELKPLFLYSSSKRVYAPVDLKNKKKGSAILLLSPSLEESIKLMKLPYIHNPGLFTSYYMDRNVMSVIDKEDLKDIELDEEREEIISEALRKEASKFKFIYEEDVSSIDKRYTANIFDSDVVERFLRRFRLDMRECDINVKIYHNISQLRKEVPKSIMKFYDNRVYSFSDNQTIHIISRNVFDPDSMGGTYDIYLMNELYCFLIMKYNPNLHYDVARAISSSLSGRSRWIEDNENHIEPLQYDRTANYIDIIVANNEERILEKYIKRGNIDIMAAYIHGQTLKGLKRLTEAELSYSERQMLLPSEFGIPDKRKYPMPDEDHVRAAIRMFNNCDEDEEAELASNIIKKLKKFNIKDIKVGKNNRFYKYYEKAYPKNESTLIFESKFNSKEMTTDIFSIINTLDDKDRNYIGNGYWVDKNKSIYRDIEYVDNIPVGFIDIYNLPKFPDCGLVIIAISKEYRGRGISNKLITKAKEYFRNHKTHIKYLRWLVDNDNHGSKRLAEREGFKFNKRLGKEYEYLYTLESTILNELASIPDNKIVVGTDFHFIGYDDKEMNVIFKSDSYIDHIIEKQNELCGKDGIFIFLGDLFYKGFHSIWEIPAEMRKRAIEVAKKFKGKYKIFIRGNHDNLPDEFYLNDCGFTHICSSLTYNNIIFTHQPEIVKPDKINIHGHIHDSKAYSGFKPENCIDVYSVGGKNLRLATLPDILDAQEEYNKGVKSVTSVKNLDPHQFIDAPALDLDEIVTENAILESGNSINNFKSIDINDAMHDMRYHEVILPIFEENISGEMYLDDHNNCICYYAIQEKTDGHIWLVALEVSKDYRRRKLAYQMLKKAMKEGATHLSVGKDNVEAVALYKKLGFRIYKETGGSYLMSLEEGVIVSEDTINLNPEFDEVRHICHSLAPEELARLTWTNDYENKPSVIKRIISRDQDERPLGFLDLHYFPSRPDIAQITIAVDPAARGNHIADDMVRELLDDKELIDKYKFDMFYWTAHQDNIASQSLAMKHGFVDTGIIDKHGRKVFIRKIDNPEEDKIIKEITSLTENGLLLEADDTKTYTTKIRRYLYRERIKSNKGLLEIYDKVKTLNPDIRRTYMMLKLYKSHNLFVDLSYYHSLFLRSNTYKLDRGVRFYFDFLNRLLNTSELDTFYKKKTIFIPVDAGVWPIVPGTHVSDYKNNINPISVLFRLIRIDLGTLRKEWGDKDIIFVGSRGYFKIDFNKVELKNLARIKRNIDKLMSSTEIIKDEFEEDDLNDEGNTDGINDVKNSDSSRAMAMNVIDKIGDSLVVDFDDTSSIGVSTNINKAESNKNDHMIIKSTRDPFIINTEEKETFVIFDISGSSSKSLLNTPEKINVYCQPK